MADGAVTGPPGPSIAALALAAALLLMTGRPRRLPRPGAVGAGPAGANRRRAVPAVFALAGGVVAVPHLPVPTVLAAAILAATLARRHAARTRRAGADTEVQALRDGLEILAGELRAGAHPVRAFEIAAAETSCVPVRAGLQTVAARARLGADVPAGLAAAGRSATGRAHWRRLAVHWRLADEHGLAIAALMAAAHRDLTERQRFSEHLAAGLAGARASAAILAGLPVLGAVLGELIGAHPVAFLLGGRGGPLLVVGTALSCAGLAWADRITGVRR